eukprot:CAMPEP_0170549854 /NCGR_PEP_ID=MMETSP0211-20121228/7979_1 /TAXON_ID=311385 /ORGANISM="Pseudokeronopsis sp., Strain OXSARD2" /LENGTH=65 /DNA_ID=CAMNT_0010856103 /DNA_START=154 /DNA_END=352 /DNA_ORIENTATION=-
MTVPADSLNYGSVNTLLKSKEEESEGLKKNRGESKDLTPKGVVKTAWKEETYMKESEVAKDTSLK